jgi:hypothetical protein
MILTADESKSHTNPQESPLLSKKNKRVALPGRPCLLISILRPASTQ